VALFAEEFPTALDLAREASLRIGMQLGPFSMQMYEIKRTRPLHYSLFNLSGWWTMQRLAREFAIDLGRYRGAEGESLGNAVRFCVDNRQQFADYGPGDEKHDLWLTVLDDVLGPSRQGHRAWIVDSLDWGLPPLLWKDA
jgi:hypothetical protein